MSRTLLVIALLVAAVAAQSPLVPQGNCTLDASWAPLGGTATVNINGPQLQPFLMAIDLQPGDMFFPGFGHIWLGFTPNLIIPLDGFSGFALIFPGGTTTLNIPVPNAPANQGIIAFMQSVILDPGSPNLFSLTNGVSFHFDFPDSYLPVLGVMGEPRSFHQTTPLPDGSFLVSGGGNGTLLLPNASMTTEIYDPYTRTFGAGPMMGSERTLHRATALQDGRVLASGGSITLGMGLNTAEIYDPATNTWAPTATTMNAVRIAHTATVLDDGRVLVCGGSSSFVLTPPTSTNYLPIFNSSQNTAEIYDPVADTWTPTANNMADNRFGHAATLLPNGTVLVSGGVRAGQTVFGTGAPLYCTTSEIFDPATNTFSTVPNMAIPRVVHTQHLLPNGTVLALGGGGGSLLVSLGSTEIFDPATNTWSAGPSLPASQTLALHQSCSMPNGDVYVGGGAVGAVGAFQGVNVAYRYDASAGSWVSLGTLPAARQSHSVNYTPSGVLLIGGADAGNPTSMPPVPAVAVDTAELWTPDT